MEFVLATVIGLALGLAFAVMVYRVLLAIAIKGLTAFIEYSKRKGN